MASKTSSRVMVIFTGLPVFFESSAASGSRYMPSLPPKPPPISTAIQVMSETGMSKSARQEVAAGPGRLAAGPDRQRAVRLPVRGRRSAARCSPGGTSSSCTRARR